MSLVTKNQPEGTPTWIDLEVPDLDRAMDFYGALFGWDFEVGPEAAGGYTICLLRDRAVAALSPNPAAEKHSWSVYLATDDCDAAAARVTEAGGTVPLAPMDVLDKGRMALVRDPVGARFALWQGRARLGVELVNEPGTLVRNDLVTADAGPAREFYAAVFGFSLDRNEDVPEFDFTFLRRTDGHEVAGIFGLPEAPESAWNTTFEVADTDDVVRRAVEAGGTAGAVEDMLYGRIATITDPFGAEFSVITRPPA
ncbi:VOC family protein [Amycolatopsis nigrescens]|uniref:VOC family protein n=1 Tax=Amycolatopsis nigrescens TaxID=381445 RepID=UPI0004783CC2|nr:VOC family protein [Amycolatopsis nigrescens]